MTKQFYCSHSDLHLSSILCSRAQAAAVIRGSEKYPDVLGTVLFYQTHEGVIVFAEICGLPDVQRPCYEGIFGFHIHQGTDCEGNMKDPFADAMQHFDLANCAHPYHAGDLPPLCGNKGLAISAFLTNRFSVDEIVGRTVIIHNNPDDFVTQPSGNSGTKIACGEIKSLIGPGI